MNEEINKIQNIDHSMKFLIEHADMLFNDKKLKLNIVDNHDKSKKLLRIYINNSLCLWFYKDLDSDKAVFDGWEMGDYSNI